MAHVVSMFWCCSSCFESSFVASKVLSQMGGSQNQGPILVPLNIGCCNLEYTQKRPRILRTAQISCQQCGAEANTMPAAVNAQVGDSRLELATSTS